MAGQVTGSRTYEIVLMPEQAGGLTIPEIRYPYFDPALERYVELATGPIAVSISDAAGSPAVPLLPAIAQAEEEGPEIRPKAVPPSLRQAGTELASSSVYWAAWAIPALIIAGAVVWRWRHALQETARAEALRNAALPDARAALARAVGAGGDPRMAASDAVLSYLSARLESPVSGLTREALVRWLREAGVSPDLEDKVNEVLGAGESARYTPPAGGSAGADGHAEWVSQLLGELEGAISV